MRDAEFYGLVQQESQAATADRAQVASRAVLGTLGETISAGEAEDVAAQLPAELGGVLENADHDGAGYDRDAFVERVDEHLRGTELEGADSDAYIDAVTDALATALTEDELENLKAQLDGELRPFFEGVDVDPEAARAGDRSGGR